MNTRIYFITDGTRNRLIRAANQAQAMSHAARTLFRVRVASQDDLVASLSAGARVEDTQNEEHQNS